jgi:hypothetical protein
MYGFSEGRNFQKRKISSSNVTKTVTLKQPILPEKFVSGSRGNFFLF